MKTYYVLIETWGVYVKEGAFFEEQGGLTANWGRQWVSLQAESIEDARRRGEELRDGQVKRKVTEELHHWPYCEACHQPFWFDLEAPLAMCGCGTTEWSGARPAPWVSEPIQGEPLYFIFSSPPGSNDSNFVEVETADGRGVRVGEWKQDPKTELWKLGPVYAEPQQGVELRQTALRDAARAVCVNCRRGLLRITENDDSLHQKEGFKGLSGYRLFCPASSIWRLIDAEAQARVQKSNEEKRDDSKRGEHQDPA